MQPIILLRKHAMAPLRWISAWNTDKKVTALTISCDNDEYGKRDVPREREWVYKQMKSLLLWNLDTIDSINLWYWTKTINLCNNFCYNHDISWLWWIQLYNHRVILFGRCLINLAVRGYNFEIWRYKQQCGDIP